MPAVSVLMVFHRDQPFLRPAIASVLAQTHRDFELVLVDNGTGLPADALGEMGRDSRLRWVRLARNEGIPAGHNAGVAAATGEYIALLDHDDIAVAERLERQVAALRADPGLQMVTSAAETIDERGVVVGREFALMAERDQRVFSAYTMPAPTPSCTGRREIFLRHPYRPEFPVAADYDFFARVVDSGRTLGLREVLLRYRQYAEQTTITRRSAQILGACRIRLVTARRRAGRNEDLASLLAAAERPGSETSPAGDYYREFARRCLAEGFALLATYHARKSIAEGAGPGAIGAAMAVLMGSLRQQPRNSIGLLRMFFTGPLRAHRLHPA
jgi:glycosyltransferase involved in cell wall biosynthesis